MRVQTTAFPYHRPINTYHVCVQCNGLGPSTCQGSLQSGGGPVIGGSAGFGAIAVVVVLGGLGVLMYLGFFSRAAKGRSHRENILLCLRQLGILQMVVGCMGVISSFAYISSVLTIACGVIAFLTLRNHATTGRGADGRMKPSHGANIAIAVIFCGGVEFCIFAALLGSNIYAT
jgi:hypothetical protein